MWIIRSVLSKLPIVLLSQKSLCLVDRISSSITPLLFELSHLPPSSFLQSDIESILVPTIDEHHLVAEVQEPETDHSTINNWKLVLMEQKKICWDHLYEKDQSNRVVEVKENTREKNGDNLETNLEVGEDEIIQREVELLKKKSDQQGKAIFDLRAQLEALKGQPRDDPQPQYSSPF
ncbi:unnamed protein product [Brassica napus]|uniref:(rape) hypothetical protein n=1 Tax=Brassica napus TaxID=3708 RepID=A0A816WXH7_BRANA|nr:unnamed protein product [Brassica napus]